MPRALFGPSYTKSCQNQRSEEVYLFQKSAHINFVTKVGKVIIIKTLISKNDLRVILQTKRKQIATFEQTDLQK